MAAHNESFAEEADWLDTLVAAYGPVHPPLVICICVVGSLLQLTMILVLTRRELVSATNALLVSLSVSQLCLLLNYLYITLYKLFADFRCNWELWGARWAYFLLLNVNLSVVFHTAAVFHVLALSGVRYVTLRWFSRRQSPWLSLTQAVGMSLSIYVLVLLLCVPFYLNSEVKQDNKAKYYCFFLLEERGLLDRVQNISIYTIRYSELATSSSLLQINYWLFAVICKLIPCMAVGVLTVCLHGRLKEFKAHALTVRRVNTNSSTSSTAHFSRTSYMIMAVMVLFVAVELPQGVMNLLLGILGSRSVLSKYYNSVADLFEMLVVLYSSINFLIFCGMSSQFRRVFGRMLGRALEVLGIRLGKARETEVALATGGESLRLLTPGPPGTPKAMSTSPSPKTASTAISGRASASASQSPRRLIATTNGHSTSQDHQTPQSLLLSDPLPQHSGD